ncbi:MULTISPECIES: S53 family peptidase [Acidobacterium]|uniref:Subtilase family protein n=1 Tax=Acidobacterium capsulatum (strain ATCC 51196 / DSM 11244 / BCRC 80197 / JCM 7670 / NBRC 15755 / NCIMB 13165 / 161) TaxID=240015 RepID=C1F7S8_ACIC5|nr:MULTISPECIES: S53 family peptidase [Acidobacterium]ACO33350.1 subtilase family protein [Acidobacterium capsulatum ATCC 51196]HCT59694.1 peptidase S53 [Acidobacterium sp.]
MSPIASRRSALPLSERPAPENARALAAVEPDRTMTVSVLVRRKKPLVLADLEGKKLTHREFERRYGASEKDFATIAKFAAGHGLAVDHHASSLARRTVVLRGTARQMQQAFGVTLHDYEDSETQQRYHSFTGAITVPAAHARIIESVLGLDARPIAKPHFRVRKRSAAATGAVSFNPPQVASLYSFPTGVDGSGETIGILELGGGYETSDIQQYFSGLGIQPPTVVAVSVDGAVNAPGNPNGADGEVALDIQVAGSIAPGAKLAVYFAPNTEQGFVDAITTAVHDTANKPSVLSISWGGPESSWPQAAAQSLNNACESAAALGVTITVASGDNGSTDGVQDGQNHVDFPASSPYVLACGGTYLAAVNNGVPQESVWDDLASGGGATGGGVSALFPLPAWQTGANVPGGSMRGVPDVAGDASPESGYNVLVDGQPQVVGGTSAVAPLWAALIALVNQQKGEAAGFVNAALYQNPSAFHDITQGSNGAYAAAPGWDPCTGLGSPMGTAIAKILA